MKTSPWKTAIEHSQQLLTLLEQEQKILLHAHELDDLTLLIERKKTAQLALVEFIDNLLDKVKELKLTPDWQSIQQMVEQHEPDQIGALQQFRTLHTKSRQVQNINEILLAQRMQDTQNRLQILLQQQEHDVTYTNTGKQNAFNTSRTSEKA